MSKKYKELELNIQELSFKPIDWSVYNDKVDNVKIQFDETAGTDFSVAPFNIEINDDDILKFQSAPKLNIDVKIDAFDDEYRPNTLNYQSVVQDQSLTNTDSRASMNRKSYLEANPKNWTKISLDDDSFKL